MSGNDKTKRSRDRVHLRPWKQFASALEHHLDSGIDHEEAFNFATNASNASCCASTRLGVLVSAGIGALRIVHTETPHKVVLTAPTLDLQYFFQHLAIDNRAFAEPGPDVIRLIRVERDK